MGYGTPFDDEEEDDYDSGGDDETAASLHWIPVDRAAEVLWLLQTTSYWRNCLKSSEIGHSMALSK